MLILTLFNARKVPLLALMGTRRSSSVNLFGEWLGTIYSRKKNKEEVTSDKINIIVKLVVRVCQGR